MCNSNWRSQAFLCLYCPDYATCCFTRLEFYTVYTKYLWKLWTKCIHSIIHPECIFLVAENFWKKRSHRIKQDFSKWGLGIPRGFQINGKVRTHLGLTFLLCLRRWQFGKGLILLKNLILRIYVPTRLSKSPVKERIWRAYLFLHGKLQLARLLTVSWWPWQLYWFHYANTHGFCSKHSSQPQ